MAEHDANPHAHLYGFSGKIASGKSTIARGVARKLHPQDSVVISFADALKDEVNDIIALVDDSLRNGSSDLFCDSATDDEVALGVILANPQFFTPRVADGRVQAPVSEMSTVSALVHDVRNAYMSAGLSPRGKKSALKGGTSVEKVKVSRRAEGRVEFALPDAHGSKTPHLRRALQIWGTNVRRAQNANYWVDRTEEKIVKLLSCGVSVFVDDVRFPNEANLILERGGTLVRLDVSEEILSRRQRSRDSRAARAKGVSGDALKKAVRPTGTFHSSETALDEYEKFTRRFNLDDSPSPSAAIRHISAELSSDES